MTDLYNYLSELSLGPDVHVLTATVSDPGQQPLVKVVVDTPTGITIDEIAGISRLLRKDADVASQVGAADFRLEVTSPGIGSGLKEPWQYPRHVGRRLAVQLGEPAGFDGSRISVEGELLRTSRQGIILRLADVEEEIAWERIQQAVVQLNW
jgi:ribosome maturation factor RimP